MQGGGVMNNRQPVRIATPRIRIIHETNPHKYFPALFALAQNQTVHLAGAHRYSVIKEWLRAGVREKRSLAQRNVQAMQDLAARIRLFFVKDETIILGFAPWDWRMLFYALLARKNQIIYHTSWHDWRQDHTPRQPWPRLFKRLLRARWLNLIARENVRIVAVSQAAANGVLAATGKHAAVIPHAVPDIFFNQGKLRKTQKSPPAKLIFVGELSEKKGVLSLFTLINNFPSGLVSLTIVGDGPLFQSSQTPRDTCYVGSITCRTEMAKLMAKHDVLVLPSLRQTGWEELFGIVLVEALACGLAIIASNHVGPREILRPCGGLGLFDDDDLEGMRQLLTDLASAPDLRQRLAKAQARGISRYSQSTIEARWEALLCSA